MNIRQQTEQNEELTLSKYAAKSAHSKGRKRLEEPCDIRTAFQHDRDKVTHSKAFRRLMHKTQVFIAPEGDHFRTRLTHTLEVAQIGRTIARALRLNEDLTEAIALAHDLGHTPFGHTGEEVLNQIVPDGFEHNIQGLRIVERIERDGRGLNLTLEVLDGILNHRTKDRPSTLEGEIVRLADKIAYINHDIDDSIRAGMLTPEQLPPDCVALLGDTTSSRIDCLVRSVIYSSLNRDTVTMEPEIHHAMGRLKAFMYETVYLSQINMVERRKIKRMLSQLYAHYLQNLGQLEGEFQTMLEEGESPERVVCDYIACMTDRFAVRKFNELFIPKTFGVL